MALTAMVVKESTSEVAHKHDLKVIKYVQVNEDNQTLASQEKQKIDAKTASNAKSLVTAYLWQHVGTACHCDHRAPPFKESAWENLTELWRV